MKIVRCSGCGRHAEAYVTYDGEGDEDTCNDCAPPVESSITAHLRAVRAYGHRAPAGTPYVDDLLPR